MVFSARISISISVDTLTRFKGGIESFGSGRRRDLVDSSRSGERESGRRMA